LVVGSILEAEQEKAKKTGVGFKDRHRVQLRLSQRESDLRLAIGSGVVTAAIPEDVKKFVLAEFDRAVYRFGLLFLDDLNAYGKVRMLKGALAWEKPKPEGGRPHSR
jgi:hypothetical protein